jgi:hypothetical protein
MKSALIISALVVGSLVLFVSACGSVHNSSCGVLTFVALLVLAPTDAALSIIPGGSSAGGFWLVFTIVTFLMTFVAVYGVMVVIAVLKKPRTLSSGNRRL